MLALNNKHLYILLGIPLLVYCFAFYCGWVNWDDPMYVLENELVQQGLSNIGTVFTTGEIAGNYHPLTILSLTLDHSFFGLNPVGYHLTNVFFHLLNTFLLFRLMERMTQSKNKAMLVALIFALHPMHTESVVWISSRKDVLYTFFLLLGWRSWVIHRDNRSWKIQLKVVLFFVAALLSKAMAVVFPLLLLLSDYWEEKKWKWQIVKGIFPMLGISLVFGLLAIGAQKESDAVSALGDMGMANSLLQSVYGFVGYVWRFFIPVGQSAFHPYQEIGMAHYLSLAMFVGILIYLFKSRKNTEVIVGWGIFVVSLLPVLQLIPVGMAVMADRYTYVAYIGLAFWGVILADKLMSNKVLTNKVRQGVGMGVVLLLGVICALRIPVWKDGASMWSDVIEKYPDDFFAYGNRAAWWNEQGKKENEIQDLNKCLELNPHFSEGLNNRGLFYLRAQEWEKAKLDFDQVLNINSSFVPALINRGIILRALGDMSGSLADFSKALPLSDDKATIYLERGVVYCVMSEFDKGISDFDAALQLRPENGMIWLYRSRAHLAKKNVREAIRDKEEAQKRGVKITPDYEQLLLRARGEIGYK